MAITVDRDLGPDDASEYVALFSDYAWWADREVPPFRDALTETDEAIGLRADGDLVAAARVLTDYVHYAMVYDVIVAEDRRGEQLGERLLQAVVDHPALSGITVTLAAREGLVPFYERGGFADVSPVDHPDGEPEDLRFLAYPRE